MSFREIHEISCDAMTILPHRSATDDERTAKCFSAVRPWVGNMMPPSDFDPATCDYGTPGAELKMDYVFGFRTAGVRDNVHWVDAPTTFLYFSAAVACKYNWVERKQEFYTGHTDDIACMAYSPKTRTAATGGLGKRNTAPLHIWDVDTMKTKLVLTGVLQFCVVAAAFSADGSRIIGIGADNVSSVGLWDVNSGALLVESTGDSNRILHVATLTTENSDSRRHFVSIGVSHIKFWTKDKDKLLGKKAYGGDITKQTSVSVACTQRLVLVGNVSGGIYLFSNGSLITTVHAHDDFCGAIHASTTSDVVFTGGRDGSLKKWEIASEFEMKECGRWNVNKMNLLSSQRTGRKLKNCPRAISCCDGHVVFGTSLGTLGVLTTDAVDLQVVLDGHFEDKPGSMPELWGLTAHPSEALFATASQDATLRLWSVELGTLILLADVHYPATCCAFSPDGATIAVGHENGAFSVWDAMTLTPTLGFTRKRSTGCASIGFSPDGRFLALAMGLSHVVDLYEVHKNYNYIACCDSGSGNIRKVDWSANSRMLRCCTTSYEVVHFNIPSCGMNQSLEIADEPWATQSTTIGWGVQGIWEGCSDGTDVNCVARSRCGTLLAAGYDSSEVRLFNFPCLPRQSDRTSKLKYPKFHSYAGHSSHVTNAVFSSDNRYLLTSGGKDQTVIRWKVVVTSQTTVEETSSIDDPVNVAETVSRGHIHELPPDVKLSNAEAMDMSMRLERRFGMDNSSQKNTMRRPGSSRKQVASRLFDTTASMIEKTRYGVAQKQHLDKQQIARNRFNAE